MEYWKQKQSNTISLWPKGVQSYDSIVLNYEKVWFSYGQEKIENIESTRKSSSHIP